MSARFSQNQRNTRGHRPRLQWRSGKTLWLEVTAKVRLAWGQRRETSMPAERSQRIEQLYHAARERDPGQRDAFLQQACAGDEALRREVESLLAEEAGMKSFLET